MDINRQRVDDWKNDIEQSVDFYNRWFLAFAPPAFRAARERARKNVDEVFLATEDGCSLHAAMLALAPTMLPVLRQMTCPPLARDRLAGLARVGSAVVRGMEDEGRKRAVRDAREASEKIMGVIAKLLDHDLLPWLATGKRASAVQRARASLIVADRLCGAYSDPIIRKAQEERQLKAIADFLEARGYRRVHPASSAELRPGEFAYHLNVRVFLSDTRTETVNIPVDVAILPRNAQPDSVPLFIEAKSAGDFANINKRRKEEAQKIQQLKRTFGPDVRFVLFLCGYFDSGYLGYEAAEGIDWIWEHRMADMEALGL